MSESAAASRYVEIDLLKAVGIVGVVLIHSVRPPFNVGAADLELWLGHVTRFAVPGFLFASGFLYASEARVPLQTTLRRLRRVLLPYAIASLFAQTFLALRGEPSPSGGILLDLLLGTSFGPYYYVFQIVLLIAATPLFALLRRRSLWTLLAIAVLVQLSFDQAWLTLVRLDFVWYIRNPGIWWSYFLLGWVLRLHHAKASAWVQGRRVLLTGVFCAGALLLAGLLASSSPGASTRAATSALVYVLLGLLVTIGCAREPFSRSLRALSDAAYATYLYHLFIVIPLAESLIAAPGELRPAAILLPWSCGLAGSLVLVWTVRRLVGRRSRDLIGA